MRRLSTSGLLLLAACGARVDGGPIDLGSADAGGSVDAAPAVDAAGEPPLGVWSPPVKLNGAATSATEDDVTLSPNGLELVFAVAAVNGKDLYYTSRPARDAEWGMVVKLPLSSDAFSEEAPRFSGDGQTLYYATDLLGDLDIFAVDRLTSGLTGWGPPHPINEVNTGAVEKWFTPCAGGRYVVVRGGGNGGQTDLFEGVLGSVPPAPIPALNTADGDTGAFLTQDCLTIYFASFHVTPERIFVSHRATVTSPWPAPRQVDDFKLTSGTDNQEDPSMTADGRTFAFASDAAGGNKDIYLSTR